MSFIRHHEIPVDALPGRGIRRFVGRNSALDSVEMTVRTAVYADDNVPSGSFDPGFGPNLKNLKNAIELARETGVALPAAATMEQLMRAADDNGRGDYDHSGLVVVIEDLAGSRVADAVVD